MTWVGVRTCFLSRTFIPPRGLCVLRLWPWLMCSLWHTYGLSFQSPEGLILHGDPQFRGGDDCCFKYVSLYTKKCNVPHRRRGRMAATSNLFPNIPSVITLSGGTCLCQMAQKSNQGKTTNNLQTAITHSNGLDWANVCQAAGSGWIKCIKRALRCRAVSLIWNK